MRRVRILHCADVHLDRPFPGLAPAAASRRGREVLDAFRRALAVGREREADVYLLAGDLFEHRWVRPETLRTVAAELAALARPVFIAPGNHDPLVANSFYHSFAWPDNVHIFGPAWAAVPLPGLGAVVWGIGFDRWEVDTRPLAGFRASDPQAVNLVLMHGSLVLPGLNPEEEVYAPFTADEALNSGADYLALGHFHRATVAARRSDMAIAQYPGSPEGLDFGQQGEHGVLVGHVDKSGPHLDLVPVGLREFVRAEVDISGCGTRDQVADRVRAAFPPERRERDLFRVTLTGRHMRGLEIHPEEIAGMLQAHFHHLHLENRSGPEWDLDALAARRDLQGAFVRQVRAVLGAAGNDRERARLLRAAHLGLEAMDREVGGQ